MPTSVALSPHFEKFIRQQIESGRYSNVSEVVRAGLRLLEDQEAQLQGVRSAVAAGLTSGPDVPADEVFDRLEARYRVMAEHQG